MKFKKPFTPKTTNISPSSMRQIIAAILICYPFAVEREHLTKCLLRLKNNLRRPAPSLTQLSMKLAQLRRHNMTQTLNPYEKFLDGKPPLEVIAKTPAALQALVMRADATKLTRPPAPGKWSVREILCHLADCELVFGFRLRQTAA